MSPPSFIFNAWTILYTANSSWDKSQNRSTEKVNKEELNIEISLIAHFDVFILERTFIFLNCLNNCIFISAHTLLIFNTVFSLDIDKGFSDCVCECYHVLQSQRCNSCCSQCWWLQWVSKAFGCYNLEKCSWNLDIGRHSL